MINRKHLKEFIANNKEEILIDYRDKLYNNTHELIKKEERQTFDFIDFGCSLFLCRL